MTDKHAKRMAEKHRLLELEFKERNQKTLCLVNFFSTVVTVGLFVGTLVVLHLEPKSCSSSFLRFTLWLMLGMHLTNIIESVCQLTGLEKIFCGCCCVLGFFVYEVAVIFYMQFVLYHASECKNETPKSYWWLLVNNIVYFAFVIIAIFIHVKIWFAKPSQEEVAAEVEKDEKDDQNTKTNTMH